MSEKEVEKAANLFAGAFLMPKVHLLREASKHRQALGYSELIGLKKIYRVSGPPRLCDCGSWRHQ